MAKKKVWYTKWWGILILFFGAIMILGLFAGEEPTNNSASNFQPNTPTPNNAEVNLPEETTPPLTLPTDDTETPPPTDDTFLVTRVIDGDTIEISGGDRVRLICIDTPERGEEGYSEATDYLESLILNKEVRLEKDVSETDMYGRLLRYIYLGDSFVNELIVRNGYGEAYPYSPDTSKCPIIEDAEALAKSEEIGIWEDTPEESPPPSSSGDYVCSSDYYNCGDFSSYAEAKAVFDACGPGDIHGLDRDNDGIPCESLS